MQNQQLPRWAVIAVLIGSSLVQAAGVAKISIVEGRAELLRTESDAWRPARPGMQLMVGDQLSSREESFVEVVYSTGAIVRLDENSKIVITDADTSGTKSRSGVGEVWVNMRKLISSGKEFELSTPTATAAIRGTVFHMTMHDDSSTDVAVYQGKVSVGPSSDLHDRGESPMGGTEEEQGAVEVPGPEEIPGPYEVTLDEWLMITAGRRITVRRDGKFHEEAFDMEKRDSDAFVKKNREMDRRLDNHKEK